MSADVETAGKVVYWHRELPPISADVIGEDTVEAASERVPGSLSRGDETWRRCYEGLMEHARIRLEQEVIRQRGHYARVHDEVIETRHDEAKGEAWLYGRFDYVLYRDPRHAPAS